MVHEQQEYEPVRSRIVCKHWKNGNGFKGDKCGFNHVGRQRSRDSIVTSRTHTKVPECINGSSCEWLAKSSCIYFHPRIGVQRPWDSRSSKDSRPRQDSGSQHEHRPGQTTGADRSRAETEPNLTDRQNELFAGLMADVTESPTAPSCTRRRIFLHSRAGGIQ